MDFVYYNDNSGNTQKGLTFYALPILNKSLGHFQNSFFAGYYEFTMKYLSSTNLLIS